MALGKCLLIAEDDLDDRLLFETAYAEQGFRERVLFFENGLELMNYLEKIKGEHNEPHPFFPNMILLDLNMPKKDGKEVLKELKMDHSYKDVPIIVMSTASSDRDKNECLTKGALKFITKPHSFDKLKDTISEIHQMLLVN